MNTAGGYVYLYRRVYNHVAFRTKQEASVFVWMVTTAQWQATRFSTKYGPVSLSPGELLIAERELADDFGLHRNTLRSLLHRMVAEGIIERFLDRAPQRAGTVVRVLKFQEYQNVVTGESPTKDRKRTAPGTVAGPKRDLIGTKNNEGNEGNEVDEGKKLKRTSTESVAASATRATKPVVVVDLPSWLPAEAWAAWCHHRCGKTWTQHAAVLTLRELGKLRDEGSDPVAVIEQSIRNGWRGLFHA